MAGLTNRSKSPQMSTELAGRHRIWNRYAWQSVLTDNAVEYAHPYTQERQHIARSIRGESMTTEASEN